MKIEIDDTEDKLRRNLIMASGTILAAAWLRLPLPSLFSALTTPPAVDPAFVHRMWAAAFAIILYLLGRYHFSKERLTSWKSFREDHERRYLYMMGLYVRRARVRTQNQTQREREKEARQAALKEGKPPPIFRRYETKDIRLVNPTRYGRRIVYCQEIWTDEDDHEFDLNYPVLVDDERSSDRWEIGRIEAIKAVIKVWGQSMSWARGTFDLLVPYLLAALATAISFWNGIIQLYTFDI